MSGEGDEAERLQVLEQYRKKVRSESEAEVVFGVDVSCQV